MNNLNNVIKWMVYVNYFSSRVVILPKNILLSIFTNATLSRSRPETYVFIQTLILEYVLGYSLSLRPWNLLYFTLKLTL